MSFHYLTNVPLETAVADLLDALVASGAAPQVEEVPVSQVLGRTTAAPVYAHISAPHYHACAMDGIAVRAGATFGATPTTPVVLPPDAYTVVDTGDPLPEDCDAVVMVEDVLPCLPDGAPAPGEKPAQGVASAPADALVPDAGTPRLGTCSVRLLQAVAPWANVRQIGEDICAGEMLLTSGETVTPAAVGALLAAGVGSLAVRRRPVVAIIPTGDEVVPPTTDPRPGDVMEFNSSIFGGMVRQWGGEPKVYPIVPDDPARLRAALSDALAGCDAVLVNAGSSAGRDDYACEVIASQAAVLHHGIAIKPGKPAIVAHAGPKPVIGVPGYPVSGIMVVEQLLRPALALLTGAPCALEPTVEATLSRAVVSSLKYREFVRVRLGQVDGRLVAAPLARGAGVVTSFVKADGIVEVPLNSEGLEAGARVPVRLLRPAADLAGTLVVTGSHDPLIDELAELVHAADPALRVASTHVGSMGAITAAKRRENHCGGIHLLDEATGTYNEPYLRKHFPQGGVRQVECVYRKQGLMVAPGNPLDIRSLADLAVPGRRYVNRQKGSGTRILCDYVCRRDGVDPAAIYGYDHEELTHTAVAALVEAGSADAGMGIFSAAQMYGLDFVDVCEEQYDLLVPDYAWDTPPVRALLAALKSDEFHARVEQMGGYRLETPGRVRRHF